MWWNDIKEIKHVLFTINSKIKDFHDKVDDVKEDVDDLKNYIYKVDKLEDYIKNIDKLNTLVNEFKGCVALNRADMQGNKDFYNEIIKEMKNIDKEIKKFLKGFSVKKEQKKPTKKEPEQSNSPESL